MKCPLLGLVFALTPLLSTGCQEEPISCTLELRPSIVLDVVDAETGEEVEAMVAFQIDGGATQESDRVGSEHSLGEDEEGTFVVTVSADGYETVMSEYVVTQDEPCHVTTVEATVELVPSA
jgi:hypothetical protein